MTDPYAALRAAIADVSWHAGGCSFGTREWHAATPPDVIRALLAERDTLTAERERVIEECARVCDGKADFDKRWIGTCGAESCADAIRALKAQQGDPK